MVEAPAERARIFPGEGPSVSAARRFIGATLAQWERDDLAETAALLTSELVTNAVLHTGTEVRIVVRLNPGCLRVEVYDRSPVAPEVKLYSAEASTGRGLHLVEALSDTWGVEPSDGKVVWFQIGGRTEEATRPPAITVDLDAWPDLDDHVVDAGGDTLVEVRIVGMPLDVYRRASEHSDALQREFALIAASSLGHAAGVPARLLQLVARLRGQYGSLTAANTLRLREAVDRDDASIDLVYRVPPEAGAAAAEMNGLYDEAEDYCRSGDLVTLAGDGEVTALRRWFLGQFSRQVGGEAPSPWSGAGPQGSMANSRSRPVTENTSPI